MKFSKEKYKILNMIDSLKRNKLNDVKLYFADELEEFDQQYLGNRVSYLCKSSDIYYYSNSISEKIKNKDFDFMEEMKPYLDSSICGSGVILLDKEFQLCYDIWEDKEDDKIVFESYLINDGDFLCMVNNGWIDSKTKLIYFGKSLSVSRDTVSICPSIIELGSSYPIRMAINHQFFKKYAPIENVILSGKLKKKAKLNQETHINKNKFNINVIDSRWFTDIIKSDGFGVKGHFRMQPYGEGRKEVKLIWIKNFEKTGYTIKARKKL